MTLLGVLDWCLTTFLPALFSKLDSLQVGAGSVLAFSVSVSIITYVVGAVIKR